MTEWKVYYYPKKGCTFQLYFVQASNKEEAMKKAEGKISGTIFNATEVYNPFKKNKTKNKTKKK